VAKPDPAHTTSGRAAVDDAVRRQLPQESTRPAWVFGRSAAW